MANTDPRMDAYIENVAPFARPILTHLRKVVHAACPAVEEDVKWRHPAFMYKGILCGVGVFKTHCTFGFWKHALLVKQGLSTSDVEALERCGRSRAARICPPTRR
jgi:hypothetical protein